MTHKGHACLGEVVMQHVPTSHLSHALNVFRQTHHICVFFSPPQEITMNVVYSYECLISLFSLSCYHLAVKIKKPIKTKFRLPVFNWVALKPNQINGTVFNEIDDERILEVSLIHTLTYFSTHLLNVFRVI